MGIFGQRDVPTSAKLESPATDVKTSGPERVKCFFIRPWRREEGFEKLEKEVEPKKRCEQLAGGLRIATFIGGTVRAQSVRSTHDTRKMP